MNYIAVMADEGYLPGAVALLCTLDRFRGSETEVVLFAVGETKILPLRPDVQHEDVLAVPVDEAISAIAERFPFVRVVDTQEAGFPQVLRALSWKPLCVDWLRREHGDAEVVGMLDSDLLTNDNLDPVLRLAQAGFVVMAHEDRELFTDRRYCPEWQDFFGLGPLERRSYGNAGVVLFGHDIFKWIPEWLRCTERIAACSKLGPECMGFDQDALNALTMQRSFSLRQRYILPFGSVFYMVDPITTEAECFFTERRDLLRYTAGADGPFLVTSTGERPRFIHNTGRKWWAEDVKDSPLRQLGRELISGSGISDIFRAMFSSKEA